MKRYTALFLALALAFCLAGCRMTEETPTVMTDPSTEPTQSDPTQSSAVPAQPNNAAGILASIWEKYGEDERFAVYGGMMEAPVENAPGNLDLAMADEIASKYLLNADLLAQVEEGASLVHLMNSNLFSAAAFRLKTEVNAEAFAKTLRNNIQNNQWICGQPDKLLIASPESHYLLVAFGSEDAMKTFSARFTQSFSGAKTFYSEAVVA